MATPKIPHEVVRALLHYDPDSGLFNWRTRPAGYKGSGTAAGTINNLGYVIVTVRGAKYGAHRLAWVYHHGVWPTHAIDHINRVRHDNRIVNLRDVPMTENAQNVTRAGKTPGVTLVKKSGRWQAQLMAYGKYRYLGQFLTLEAAQEAYARGVAMYQPSRPNADAHLLGSR